MLKVTTRRIEKKIKSRSKKFFENKLNSPNEIAGLNRAPEPKVDDGLEPFREIERSIANFEIQLEILTEKRDWLIAKNKLDGITDDEELEKLTKTIKKMANEFKNMRIRQSDEYEEDVDDF